MKSSSGASRGLLLTRETADHAVDLLAEAARDTIPGALGAGVTLISAGTPTSTGYTNPLVARVDALQYGLNEGPCLTAWAGATPVLVDDTRAEPRWPRWSAAAAAIPILSCVSVPLQRGRTTIGAVKVYSTAPAAFDAGTAALLTRFAASAAALLGHIQTTEMPQRISAGLAAALRSRDAVAMARGVLMARLHLTEDESLPRLISLACESRAPLAAAARTLLAGGPGPAGPR
ncbi:ANTAR domain-containing protein [Arthrobacter crusticola]|uniref:ANTAR domain-containing protein n=1 Tax=Arthrobacter crusticola TaxID=2547960 RepID=A0A4R5TSJ8_9MICC|nr:GAF and ANTAR domain-containing protein [Arthrobacter crusticola]TDK24014.1 ANTAR domain-containing protein [Arthrobacter crusticola]